MTNTKASRQEQYKQAIGSTNCMQCAVAYMLGVPVRDVPDFSTQATALQAWEDFDGFIASRGFSSVILPPGFCPEADYLASGGTERGTKHIVVMNDGQLVFDPHPSNAGLSSIDCIRLLAKTGSAKEVMEDSSSLREALIRLERAVDSYLGCSGTTQATDLKGFGRSEGVRKELYAARSHACATLALLPEPVVLGVSVELINLVKEAPATEKSFDDWWEFHKPSTTDAYTLSRAAWGAGRQAVPMTLEQREQVYRTAEKMLTLDANLSWREAIVTCVEAYYGFVPTAKKPST